MVISYVISNSAGFKTWLAMEWPLLSGKNMIRHSPIEYSGLHCLNFWLKTEEMVNTYCSWDIFPT